MITIFYVECNLYVPSYHPVLFNALKKFVTSDLKLVNVVELELSEIQHEINKGDLLVLDHSILTSAKVEPLTNNLTIYNKNKKPDFFLEVWELILFSNKRIVYIPSFLDLFALKSNRAHDGLGIYYPDLLRRVDAIAWGYSQGLSDNYHNPYLGIEKFESHVKIEDYKNIWEEVDRNIPCMIDLPHCISTKEISNLSNRNFYNISIPGVNYATRELAMKSAIDHKLLIAPYQSYRKYISYIDQIINRIPNSRYTNPYRLMLWKALQNFTLHTSTTTFVCGSSYRYFVRKFLEVPAKKSVMITYPSVGLDNYGFKDGENAIYTYPEDVGTVAKKLINNKNVIKKLVNNAQLNLLKLHTSEVRAEHFVYALKRLETANYKRAIYFKGIFEIQT